MRFVVPWRRMIASNRVELLARFVVTYRVEISCRYLLYAIRANQCVLNRSRTCGNLAAGLAIRKDSILRRGPISHLCGIGAKSPYSFIQSRHDIVERILLAIKKAFVLVRFFTIAERANLR